MGMTEQEAIKVLNLFMSDSTDLEYALTEEFGEAIGACKRALKKQIPKKPNIEGDGYADGHLVYDTWICPNCEKDYEIDYDDYDYCPNCGQKIDKPVFDWGGKDAE